jgi:hypothetical protein
MPAILIQKGFLSNPVEKNRLFSKKKYQGCLLKESLREYWPISKMPLRLNNVYIGI